METALTTDFTGVRKRVGAWERPAVRRLLMVDTNAVTWMLRRPPSAETGSWSSSLGTCKNTHHVSSVLVDGIQVHLLKPQKGTIRIDTME
jgi:hypothetical protein